MGTTHFGDIDLGQIVDNEYRSKVIEKLLDWILEKNPQITRPTNEEFDQMREELIKTLREKYPNSDVKLIK